MVSNVLRSDPSASPRRGEPEADSNRRAATVSTREAAAALGVSEQAVRQAIARGVLAAGKQGRAYRIRRDELDRYAQRRLGLHPAQPRGKLVALPVPVLSPALPKPATRFVGRVDELATLVALLEDPAERVVTVTGPGGIGKTRLALAAAAVIQNRFRDGIHFVDLSAVTRPRLVVPAVAQSLGLRERAGQDRRGQLVAYLRGKNLLLILDNFEQILDAAPDVALLVAAAPGVCVLVTSRAPLRISGERELPVPPLSLAGADAAPDELLASDAGRLFVERVREHDPGFSVDGGSARIVAEICARLDGLPLAIELAAARAKVLPPRQLRDRLERRLPLLTLGARDAPARQRTMRDAIAWSYDLLTPDEQTLFRRLAVFAGGCTIEGAEEVMGIPITPSVLDLINALVDKSLLVREPGPQGEPRFGMLETIREYGREQLAERGEEASAHAAHARHFLRFTQTLRPLANTRSTRAPLDLLSAEDANLRVAVTWLDEHGDAADLARIVAASYAYLTARSRLREAERWLTNALGKRDQLHAAERARLLIGYAEILMLKGEPARADAEFGEGLSLLRGAGDPLDLAMALVSYGTAMNYAGHYAAGEVQLSEGLTLAETIAEPRLRAAVTGRALANLSDSARGMGHLDLAAERSEDALRRYHSQGLELAETRTLMDLGNIAKDQGNGHLAVSRYLACIAQTGEHGDMRLVADALAGIANIGTLWGQHRTALLLFGAADALRERVGIGMILPIEVAQVDHDLAVLHEAVGARDAEAVRAEGRALPLADAIAIAAAVAPPDGEPTAASAGAKTSVKLTRREGQVLRLLAEARTDREIADALFLSPRTVSWHVRGILAKLGAATRQEAVAQARAAGLRTL
jgi:excisionase family DNA binding protein